MTRKKILLYFVSFCTILCISILITVIAYANTNNDYGKLQSISKVNNSTYSKSQPKELTNSLKNKIEKANTSIVNLDIEAPITVNETITIPQGKTVNINSQNEATTILRDKSFTGVIFVVENNATLNLNNITLDGGALWTHSDIKSNQNTSSDNSYIVAKENSKVNATNTIFRNNDCLNNGAAILIENNSKIICRDCIFSDNKTQKNGGAIDVYGKLDLFDTLIFGNYAQEFGGGIFSEYNSEITLSGKIIISDNNNSNGKSNLCTNTSADKILIFNEIKNDSKIGISKINVIEENMEFATKANEYNADFGSCRDKFFFDNSNGLTPYCYEHKLIAVYWRVSNSAVNLLGDGTENNAYQISKASDMLQIEQDVNAKYMIVNDLDFSEFTTWTPLCKNGFNGELYSSNLKIIKNFKIDCAENEKKGIYEHGLFYKLSEKSKIYYLSIEGSIFNVTNKTKIIGTLSSKLENANGDPRNSSFANIFSFKSSVNIILDSSSANKDIIVGGIIGKGFGGFELVNYEGFISDVTLSDYHNIGYIAGVWDWKVNKYTKTLPDNITSHSGGISHDFQNSFNDVVYMINSKADIIEVDVHYKNGRFYCSHDEGYKDEFLTPHLEDVFKLLMGIINGSEPEWQKYESNVVNLEEAELSHIKIQLDVKDSFEQFLKYVEELGNVGIDGKKFDISRIVFCGNSGYGNMYTEGNIFNDNKEGDNHRYFKDAIKSLSDKGVIFCFNYNEIGSDDEYNNHDEKLIKKYLNDLGLNPENNNIAINIEHTHITGNKEGWKWLKEYNIGTSAYVIDEWDNVNWKERSLFNITTRDSYSFDNYRALKFPNRRCSHSQDINIPEIGNSHPYQIKDQ